MPHLVWNIPVTKPASIPQTNAHSSASHAAVMLPGEKPSTCTADSAAAAAVMTTSRCRRPFSRLSSSPQATAAATADADTPSAH